MVLLDFYATWCEPCKWSEPIIEAVLKELGGELALEKIDIDREPGRAAEFRVLSVPTFILMDGEREIWRMRGFDTAPRMLSAIRAAIQSNNA